MSFVLIVFYHIMVNDGRTLIFYIIADNKMFINITILFEAINYMEL